MLDLGVCPRRPLRRAVAVAGARHDQVPQPAVLGVPVGHVERRQLRGDQRQPERALLAEFGRGGHHLGALREQPRHLLPRPQMRTAQRRKPTGGLVHRVPGPDRAHRHGQPAARRLGEVRGGGGDDADTEPRRQRGQRGVALVVERMAVMGQLDADPVGAEPVHQIGQRRRRRFRAALGKRLAHMAFAAAGQDVPVPAGGLGQRVDSRSAACPSHRRPDAPRPAVATAADSPPARGPAPAGAARADRDPRCGRRRRATVRRRTPSACRVPWRPRRTAPPRRARRGRSARWRADRAGRPPRRVPPACWRRRGSCTPNARAVRRTGPTRRGRCTSSGW